MFLMFHASASVSFQVGFTLLLLNITFVISLIILSALFQLFPLPLSRRHTHDCYLSTLLSSSTFQLLPYFTVLFYCQSVFISDSHSISSFQLFSLFVPFLSLGWLYTSSLHSPCLFLLVSDFHLSSFPFPSLPCCNISTPPISQTEHHRNSFNL